MNENKFVSDKVKALGADITDTVNDLVREAKPLLNHASNRITDHVSNLTHQGLDAANKGKHAIEKRSHDLMDHGAAISIMISLRLNMGSVHGGS